MSTTKSIHVRLNHQQMQMLYGGAAQLNMLKGRNAEDDGSSLSEQYVPVEFSFQDTFTSLLEKCLIAFKINNNESSSTNFSNEDQNSFSRGSVTKQALLYDQDHNLVTMLQEVKHDQHYTIEIIDSKLLALNQLAGSPLLPIDAGSDPSGSLSGSNHGRSLSRKSSLAYQSAGSFGAPGRYESFASGGGMMPGHSSRLLSHDSDDLRNMSKSDLATITQVGQRRTNFRVALVGSKKSGKTSLAYRFVDRSCFLDEYEPTIVDTFEQDMNMIDPSDGLNRVVNLTIVDIGSHVLKEQMLLDCDAVLFCYDVTSQESFYALSNLFQVNMLLEHALTEEAGAGGNDTDEEDLTAAMATLTMNSVAQIEKRKIEQKKLRHKPVVLVGCKSDLTEEREIDYVDGERCAESFKAPYIECSAQSNNRVEDVFELVLIQLFKKERLERDEELLAQQQKRMLQGGMSETAQRNRLRGQDQACCGIF